MEKLCSKGNEVEPEADAVENYYSIKTDKIPVF